MNSQSFGMTVATLRKEKKYTQLELAEKLGVTDKAVSKWERDLSYPDVSTIPLLAEILGVSVDELMQVKQSSKAHANGNNIAPIADIALKSVGLAMGVAVTVLSSLNSLDVQSAIGMLGIGLACVAISSLQKKDG